MGWNSGAEEEQLMETHSDFLGIDSRTGTGLGFRELGKAVAENIIFKLLQGTQNRPHKLNAASLLEECHQENGI